LELSKNFVPLPFRFDAARLAEEALALPDSAWLPHPGGLKGNSAVPLISVGGGQNDFFHGRMGITSHLKSSPYHQQALASFNEILGRSRLMRLEPGAEVSAHIDVDYHWLTRVRIHVPIVTDPDVIFHCAEDQVHMKEGDCWIFDSWKVHKVVNDSPVTRIHLVVDTSGSPRFWKTVREMETYGHQTNLTKLSDKIKFVPYEDGKRVKIATENFNVTSVMSPGEMDALVKELISDFDGNPKNDSVLEAKYKRFLRDFGMDWRQAWLAYGYSQEGWPHYQSLIRKLFGRLLERNNDAVTLKSNGFSVNLVIIKRMLMPAFDAEIIKELV